MLHSHCDKQELRHNIDSVVHDYQFGSTSGSSRSTSSHDANGEGGIVRCMPQSYYYIGHLGLAGRTEGYSACAKDGQE